MLLLTIFVLVSLQKGYFGAMDLNAILPRTQCFENHQENCSRDFIDVYKHLSKSATNNTEARTYMLLYTRKNPEEPEKLHKCAGRLPRKSNFNPRHPTIVIFHPFNIGFCDVAVYREWTNQIFLRQNANVIVIDYSWGQHVDYVTAVMNTRRVVRYQVAILLRNIQRQTRIKKRQITLIGHSLGAQLAGMVGNLFPVKRIIALDPAGPAFAEDETSLEDRLDRSDAEFVEVWHCNMGCLPNLGIPYDPGHVNFYINGGQVQPACYAIAFESLIKKDFVYGFATLLIPQMCFHGQCALYLKVSFNPHDCQFIGVKCDSYEKFKTEKCSCGTNGENCLIMGWDTINNITEIPSTPQRYYVETSISCDYCDNSYVK